MSKKSKDNKKKKKALNLKNIVLGLSSLLLVSFLFFQIKSVVGNVISKESIDYTVNTVLSDLFPDIPAPPPPPPPPFAVCGDLLTDQEGNSYRTMEVDGLCWMIDNLNTGVMLASASTMPNTQDNIIEKWCYNNDSSICKTEGGLYHWEEAMRGSTTEGAQGICPPGWHIPTDTEMDILGNLRTSDLETFKKLFPIFPGRRNADSTFNYRSSYQYLWSSSLVGASNNAWLRHVISTYSAFYRYDFSRASGFSVRCLMD